MERFYASGKRRRLFVDTSYPGSDDRSYRVVKLANGVMAALVSDPTTEKASAALAVKVGAFSDPADVPGLAHFLEHMLFQGTTKYPGASLWKQYVAAHGGSTNAATAGETTCYQFDVVDGAFEGALDRFGRFFHESTLDATCVDREMHAVDAEHSKNLNDDGRRAYQLLRLSANQKHPFSKFSTGSLATLKRDDIRDRLVAFYEANYSPTKMTVGIVSRRPLDELEELCAAHFGQITASTLLIESAPAGEPLFPPGAQLLERVPVRALRSVRVIWPLPFALRKDYESCADRMVTHLLGHEGQGSLLFYLKKQGLALSLSAGVAPSLDEAAALSVSVELTPEGASQWNSAVLPALMTYIGRLKRLSAAPGALERLWQETSTVAEAAFDFGHSKRSAYSMAPQLAQALQAYDAADVLVGGGCGLSQRPGASGGWTLERGVRYDAILEALCDPSNLVVHLSRPKDAASDVVYETEKWYGAEFARRPLEGVEIESLRRAVADEASHASEMGLPEPNAFLPRNLAFSPDEMVASASNEPPTLLSVEESLIKTYWKRDKTFGQPKGYVQLRLAADLVERGDYSEADHGACARLLARFVADTLEAPLYEARCSFLAYDVAAAENGLDFFVAGFVGNGLDALWAALLDGVLGEANAVATAEDEKRFMRLREKLARALRDTDKGRADSHAARWRRDLLFEGATKLEDVVNAVEKTTLEDIRAFLRALVSKSKGILFAHGKLNDEDALRLADVASAKLGALGAGVKLSDRKWPTPLRIRAIPEGSTLHRAPSPNSLADVDGAVQCSYDAGARRDVRNTALVSLLVNVVKNEFFAQLRTREQLGYLVSMRYVSSRGRLALLLQVQSQAHGPEYLLGRVENFVDTFDLASLDSTFDDARKSTMTRWLEPDEAMDDEFQKWWAAVESPSSNGAPDWHRARDIAEELKTATLEEVKTLFESLLRSPSRRRLIVQVAGKHHGADEIDASKSLGGDFHAPPPSAL